MKQFEFAFDQPFQVESGESLPGIKIAYTTSGTYAPGKNPVIWVCHALTGNAAVEDWWPGLFGSEKCYDPQHCFYVCANVIGSCYGSTGPIDVSESHRFYQFPKVTIRDMVKAHELLRQHLGIEQIDTLIGASLGGQQALEWAVQFPNRFAKLILIATNAQHSPWGIAFNESQRMAIRNDRSWGQINKKAGLDGMKIARSIAMLSYRGYHTYSGSQSDGDLSKINDYRASSYQRYQGEKLAQRFNAFSYYLLSEAMDSHNVGRGRGSVEAALRTVTARTLAIGISSDLLFPIIEQKFLASNIQDAMYQEIDSDFGHDGFLVEADQLDDLIRSFEWEPKE